MDTTGDISFYNLHLDVKKVDKKLESIKKHAKLIENEQETWHRYCALKSKIDEVDKILSDIALIKLELEVYYRNLTQGTGEPTIEDMKPPTPPQYEESETEETLEKNSGLECIVFDGELDHIMDHILVSVKYLDRLTDNKIIPSCKYFLYKYDRIMEYLDDCDYNVHIYKQDNEDDLASVRNAMDLLPRIEKLQHKLIEYRPRHIKYLFDISEIEINQISIETHRIYTEFKQRKDNMSIRQREYVYPRNRITTNESLCDGDEFRYCATVSVLDKKISKTNEDIDDIIKMAKWADNMTNKNLNYVESLRLLRDVKILQNIITSIMARIYYLEVNFAHIDVIDSYYRHEFIISMKNALCTQEAIVSSISKVIINSGCFTIVTRLSLRLDDSFNRLNRVVAKYVSLSSVKIPVSSNKSEQSIKNEIEELLAPRSEIDDVEEDIYKLKQEMSDLPPTKEIDTLRIRIYYIFEAVQDEKKRIMRNNEVKKQPKRLLSYAERVAKLDILEGELYDVSDKFDDGNTANLENALTEIDAKLYGLLIRFDEDTSPEPVKEKLRNKVARVKKETSELLHKIRIHEEYNVLEEDDVFGDDGFSMDDLIAHKDKLNDIEDLNDELRAVVSGGRRVINKIYYEWHDRVAESRLKKIKCIINEIDYRNLSATDVQIKAALAREMLTALHSRVQKQHMDMQAAQHRKANDLKLKALVKEVD